MQTLNLQTIGMEPRAIFSPEHVAYRESVRRFFREAIEPNITEWEEAGHFPASLFVQAGNAGLLCPGIPIEYGGGGGDFLHQIILFEEHGYSVAGPSIGGGLGTDVAAILIHEAATEEQRREWLPRFAAGTVISEIALTESQSGSDLGGIKTTARREGDEYVISGSKSLITGANIANMLMVVAKTGPKESRGGLSTFIVDLDSPGVSRGQPTRMMSHRASNVGDVFFDDVRVPASNLLGGVEGKGLTDAHKFVAFSRLALASRILAACELAFAVTVEFVKGRRAFGQTIFDFQNTKFKLADIKTELTIARSFLDDVLRGAANDDFDQTKASMAKLWISELEARVVDASVQMHGGVGFSDEYLISRLYTAARVNRLYVGTSEIQRLLIARTI